MVSTFFLVISIFFGASCALESAEREPVDSSVVIHSSQGIAPVVPNDLFQHHIIPLYVANSFSNQNAVANLASLTPIRLTSKNFNTWISAEVQKQLSFCPAEQLGEKKKLFRYAMAYKSGATIDKLLGQVKDNYISDEMLAYADPIRDSLLWFLGDLKRTEMNRECKQEDTFSFLLQTESYKKWINECYDYQQHSHPLLSIAILENKENKSYQAVKALLDHGANVNNKDWSLSMTPLHIACTLKQHDIASLLIDYDANIDTYDINGQSPLHRACASGSVGLVKLLVDNLGDNDASLNEIDAYGSTPLDIAMRKKIDAISGLLRQNGAKMKEEMNSYVVSGGGTKRLRLQ